jgi:ParB family chromosome partitioning protein
MPLINDIRRKLPMLKKPTEQLADAPCPAAPQAAVVDIPIGDIVPNRSQPRTSFNQNAIARLSDSIRRYGILQPLTVRKMLIPSDTCENAPAVRYELVAGERRLRAAKLAEMAHVPCIIINTDDATSAELAIIENLLREDLNMFEQAEAFSRLIREFHLTQDEAARRVSMSQSAVANKLRILRLLPEERQKILTAGLTERHARALLKLSDPTLRGEVLDYILERKLNVSASEAYIDRLLTDMARYNSRATVGRSAPSATNSESDSIWACYLSGALPKTAEPDVASKTLQTAENAPIPPSEAPFPLRAQNGELWTISHYCKCKRM